MEDAAVEAIEARFAAVHRLQPIVLPHYPLASALRQKVHALVGRAEVQSRDLFDLSVLLARSGGDVSSLAAVRDQLSAATTRALDLTFDDYTSQVVAYLDPAEAEGFGSRASWDALQTQVVEALERARASA